VRVPPEAYPILASLDRQFPHLRAADRRALTWWVYGAILAGSACQAAVVTALTPLVGAAHQAALRQRLREVFKDGAEHATPCPTDLDPRTCFAPLLRWVLEWWQGDALPLALDATALRDRGVVISVSVLYRGSAIPVAWHVTTTPGPWLGPAIEALQQLAPAVPPERRTLVLADRGLWSPQLWQAIRAVGWHPLLRIRPDATFTPTGGRRVAAQTLVPGPGHAWVGRGIAYKHAPVRQPATLLVTWGPDQPEPWLLLTDLAPDQVGPCWYGLRTWIELGFRALKSLGWQWERTRRTDPVRMARHWLVLAVATLWTLATGTRDEDAERLGRPPSHLRVAKPPPATAGFQRTTSIFARGLARLRWQLLRTRRLWSRQWLWPEALPLAPPGLVVTVIPEPLPV
jgi:hypothetical protein